MNARTAFVNALIAQRVFTRFVTAADYKEYVERKRREGERPLDKKEWEARIQGGKDAPKPKEKPRSKEDEPKGKEKPKGKLSLKDRLKSLSSKAAQFLKSAPKQVRQFVEDPKARKEALNKAVDAIKKAPGKLGRNAVAAAKKEIHEFKEAGQGIATVLKGGKMSPKQKKALKTVALDVALTVAVVAVSGGIAGGLTGIAKKSAVSYGTAFAKRVALNAVTHGLGNVVTLQEVQHGTHGLMDLLSKLAAEKKTAKPDEVLGYWVEGLVAKELAGATDEDVIAALEDMEASEEG